MSRTNRIALVVTGLLATTALVPPPALAEGGCPQWTVPPSLVARQTNNIWLTFKLIQEGTQFYGKAYYNSAKGLVIGNASGSIDVDKFSARVLWTYSGVNAIGRYSGIIKPNTEVPAGSQVFGWIGDGDTYNEYDPSDFGYWNANHFICVTDLPQKPVVAEAPKVPAPQFDQQKKHDAALATIAAEKNTVKAQGRVRVEGAPAAAAPTPMSICNSARIAKGRNSPAAPGLEQQCLAKGGFLVLEPPLDAAYLETLASTGSPIVDADPLLSALRAQQAGAAGERGVHIGVAATGQDTLPGPGKQHIYNSLAKEEQPGYDTAVSFMLQRNSNRDLAAAGAAIALADAEVAAAHDANPNVFYQLGFDIATGLFGDPALGARGNTLMGPGSEKIRASLSPEGQQGFTDSVTFHQARDYSR